MVLMLLISIYKVTNSNFNYYIKNKILKILTLKLILREILTIHG